LKTCGEGFELQVQAGSYIKEIDNVKCEPYEHLTCDVPDSAAGTVIEMIGSRKGEMINMANMPGGVTRLEFIIPARGLIGFRGDFLTETRGEGIMSHVFHSFQPYKGEIQGRSRGVLIASDPANLPLTRSISFRTRENVHRAGTKFMRE
jgi:GTP-binding protein